MFRRLSVGQSRGPTSSAVHRVCMRHCRGHVPLLTYCGLPVRVFLPPVTEHGATDEPFFPALNIYSESLAHRVPLYRCDELASHLSCDVDGIVSPDIVQIDKMTGHVRYRDYLAALRAIISCLMGCSHSFGYAISSILLVSVQNFLELLYDFFAEYLLRHVLWNVNRDAFCRGIELQIVSTEFQSQSFTGQFAVEHLYVEMELVRVITDAPFGAHALANGFLIFNG